MTTPNVKRISKRQITVTVPDLPQNQGTKTTIIGNRILFVQSTYDEDCGNPLEDCDGIGAIWSASTKHRNYTSFEDLKDILDADHDAVALSYYEHGNSFWMVMGGQRASTPGIEFQWDGVRFAGVWVPDKDVRESYTGQDNLTRPQWMAQQAESACEQYTAWCNGDCWRYSVEVFKLRKSSGTPLAMKDDYRYETPEYEDSCCGFIGWDYFSQELREQATHGLRRLYELQGFSKRAISAAFHNVERE